MAQREKHTPAVARYTLNSQERLKLKRHIDTLFSLGKAYSVFPILLKYHLVNRAEGNHSPTLAGFSVPKKNHKQAVARNRIKRQMREAWRLQKTTFNDLPTDKQLHVFFVFSSKEKVAYKVIEDAIKQCVDKLKKVLYE